MKTTELNKIIKEIKFADKFIKNGRLAYYIIKDKSGASVLIGFYLDSSVIKTLFSYNTLSSVYMFRFQHIISV